MRPRWNTRTLHISEAFLSSQHPAWRKSPAHHVAAKALTVRHRAIPAIYLSDAGMLPHLAVHRAFGEKPSSRIWIIFRTVTHRVLPRRRFGVTPAFRDSPTR